MKKKTVFKHKYSKTYFFTVMNTIHKINHNISARLLFFKKIAFLSAKLQFPSKLIGLEKTNAMLFDRYYAKYNYIAHFHAIRCYANFHATPCINSFQ